MCRCSLSRIVYALNHNFECDIVLLLQFADRLFSCRTVFFKKAYRHPFDLIKNCSLLRMTPNALAPFTGGSGFDSHYCIFTTSFFSTVFFFEFLITVFLYILLQYAEVLCVHTKPVCTIVNIVQRLYCTAKASREKNAGRLFRRFLSQAVLVVRKKNKFATCHLTKSV